MDNYNNTRIKGHLPTGIGLLLAVSLSGCQPTNDNPAIATSTQTENVALNNEVDATASALTPTKTEFPYYNIGGIAALLHPITPVTLASDANTLSSSKSRGDKNSPAVFEEVGTYDYRTYASNFVFEDMATGEIQRLMPNNDFIVNQMFLPHITQPSLTLTKTIARDLNVDNAVDIDVIAKTTATLNEQKDQALTIPFNHIIYHVSETPYVQNIKGKNIARQQALYMSNRLGKNLTKLHPDNEFIQDTKWMPQVSRYYFTTQSDSDSNGIINEEDDTHNYKIDFSEDAPVVKGYDYRE